MIIKPTTSIYAPFYLSSRRYGVFVKGDWPGFFDLAASDPTKVKIEFEGPRFELKIYTAATPVEIVKAHSADAGLPILPPKWMFTPWRWRDEHTQRATYYDGTKVTGPFNSEVMEDVLMMRAYGIPNGVYWIDRPWGPGKPWGYDDFDIDYDRLPNFDAMQMITAYDWNHGTVMNMKEARLMNSGVMKGQVEHKYDYSAIQFDTSAYGWSSTKDKIGIWLINPSNEYMLNVARKSMKLYFLRFPPGSREQRGATPQQSVAMQVVEVDLGKLFADSAAGTLRGADAYQRVCGTTPPELGAGGDMREISDTAVIEAMSDRALRSETAIS